MAASLRRSSSPESSNSHSRQRHGHVRQGRGTRRPRKSRCHQTQEERGRDLLVRQSPPRQLLHHAIRPQLLTPMTPPASSTQSLTSLGEHAKGFEMERTPSGNSIISDNTFEPQHDNTLTCGDEQAARMVESHFKGVPSHGQHQRILRNIIERRDLLDEDALDGIITSADSVFFNGALRGRVRWEWSSQQRYMTDLLGTTALRPAKQGGFETLIVLSKPILTHPDFNRALLLSAFLHELVHCYLFIRCGFDARVKGGHTPGFHQIAGIIDKWVGGNYLRLCSMKANLNDFRELRPGPVAEARAEVFRESRHRHNVYNQIPMPEFDFFEDTDVTGHWQ